MGRFPLALCLLGLFVLGFLFLQGMILVTVQDTGQGIPREKLGGIFKVCSCD